MTELRHFVQGRTHPLAASAEVCLLIAAFSKRPERATVFHPGTSPLGRSASYRRHSAKAKPKRSASYDASLYKKHNIIERFLSKLKQFRRVATRYDKLLVNFVGFVKLAAIAIWLR